MHPSLSFVFDAILCLLYNVKLHQNVEYIVHVLLIRKTVLLSLLQHGAYRRHLMMICAELSRNQRPSSITVHPRVRVNYNFQTLVKRVKECYRFPDCPVTLTLIWFAYRSISIGYLRQIGLLRLLLLFLLALILTSYLHKITRDDQRRLLNRLSRIRQLRWNLFSLTALNGRGRCINYQFRYLRRVL